MRFTVCGMIEDRPVELTWDRGRLTGDSEALQELQALAQVLDGQPVGPEPDGPFSEEHHLRHPLSAWLLMEDVLDEVQAVTGDHPQQLRAA